MKLHLIRRTSGVLAGILSAVLIAFVLSCTIKDNNGQLAVTGPNSSPDTSGNTTVVLNPAIFAATDSAYVGVGDTMTVYLTVFKDSSLKDSTVLSNALVTVSASAGKVLHDSVHTASNGTANVRFTDTASGTPVLTFRCGRASITLQLDVTNTPDKVQKRLRIIPDRSVLKADGKDSTLIEVIVINPDNNPLPGQAVRFVSTAGIISAIGTSSTVPGQAVTDNNGTAWAMLRSVNINDTASVTAFMVSDRTLSDQTQIVFQGVTIAITVDSSNLHSNSATALTALVLNASGVPISFTSAFIDTTANLSLTSHDTATSFDGHIHAVVKGTQTGAGTVTIRCAGATARATINVTNLTLTTSLDATTLQASPDKYTLLHATFLGSNSSPLASKSIWLIRNYLTRAGADTADTMKSTTDTTGKAQFTVQALGYQGTMQLEVFAFNGTDVASSQQSIQFITSRQMVIQAIPSIIQADGTSASVITVIVKNSNNNPLIGETVLFKTDAGMVTASATSDSLGKAVASLVSDRRNATAHVTATLESDPTKTLVVAVGFSGVTISATANPPSIKGTGADTCRILMTLVDAAKNPITGETVNFASNAATTRIVRADTATDNRGEATCVVVGTGTGQDTILIAAAGASAQAVVSYSPNSITIDTTSLAGKPQSYLANGIDSTHITITFRNGNGTAIANAPLQISVTLGDISGQTTPVFSVTDTTNAGGQVAFFMHNPNFANTATISVKAVSAAGVTAASLQIYFSADRIDHITLIGTPAVISTNGDRAKITATAFDAQGNRVGGAAVSFNMISGPGGGEYLSPPTATTADDGTAVTYLFSGTAPSNYNAVWVVAGDFGHNKSDTAKFTIAGPPVNITVGANILKGVNPNDGTFGLPVAAIVTDINGNPVADGTAVTFSLQISGYQIWHPRFLGWDPSGNPIVDTVDVMLPFEDFNNNYKCDPGEDRNGDGVCSRGEDINGDGLFQPGPGFIDINGDGRRQYKFVLQDYLDSLNKGAPYHPGDVAYQPAEPFTLVKDATGKWVWNNSYLDMNGNGVWDATEPLRDPTMTDSAYEAQPGFNPLTHTFVDIDWGQTGVCQPSTAVSITRTIQTVGGKAVNQIAYGQSDALHIQVMIWAEAQGVVTKSPVQFILPIVQ